jgi:hypothetical protein
MACNLVVDTIPTIRMYPRIRAAGIADDQDDVSDTMPTFSSHVPADQGGQDC